MMVISSVKELKSIVAEEKRKKKTIGFVPTMGALHQGHLSLIKKAREESDFVIVSIFVNPTQFNEKSDFETYPVNFEKDIDLIKNYTDLIFAPSITEMYPEGNKQKVSFNFGNLEKVLEGEKRPGHFNGVGQIVSKLFDVTSPDKAFFGEKDYQQLLIIKDLVKQLESSIEIIPVKTYREKNGLAMSSRNLRLSEKGKIRAGLIFETLSSIKENFPNISLEEKREILGKTFKVEYLEIYDSTTLQKASNTSNKEQLRVFVAAWLEGVRLIDNMALS